MDPFAHLIIAQVDASSLANSPGLAAVVGAVAGLVLGTVFGFRLGKSIGHEPRLPKVLLATSLVVLAGGIGFFGWHGYENGASLEISEDQVLRNVAAMGGSLVGILVCLAIGFRYGRKQKTAELTAAEAAKRAAAELRLAEKKAAQERERAEQERLRRQAEEEARRRAEELAAKQRAEQERQRRQAEEEARRRAEEEAAKERERIEQELQRQRAEEEARRRAEEEAAKERERVEQERQRQRAEEEARRRAEEEAAKVRERIELERQQHQVEEDAKRRAEDDAQREHQRQLRAEGDAAAARKAAEARAESVQEQLRLADRKRDLEAKRSEAEAWVNGYSATAVATVLGTSWLPGSSTAILCALQATMCYHIGKIYNTEWTMSDAASAAGMIGITAFVARLTAMEAMTFVPFVGWAAKSGIAAGVVWSMGQLVIKQFEDAA